MRYIASFYTHLSAMMTDRALKARGIPSRMAPVPRTLSSSCGTCVRYEADGPQTDALDEDVEAVYIEEAPETFRLLMKNE